MKLRLVHLGIVVCGLLAASVSSGAFPARADSPVVCEGVAPTEVVCDTSFTTVDAAPWVAIAVERFTGYVEVRATGEISGTQFRADCFSTGGSFGLTGCGSGYWGGGDFLPGETIRVIGLFPNGVTGTGVGTWAVCAASYMECKDFGRRAT